MLFKAVLQVVTLLVLLPFALSFAPSHRTTAGLLTLQSATTGVEDNQNSLKMLQCNENTKACFAGKSILLTGASGGLGSSLAKQLACCQVDTLILSGRKKEALEKVAEECQTLSSSTSIHIITCDLADKESVKKLGEESLALCGIIDVLVNNGGVSSRSDFLDTQLAVDERLMQINFFAGASLAKALVPKMVEKKSGNIIWISSVQGLIGIPSRTSYAASKFAVQGYCESLRAEMASSGVTVHVASPGYIRTGLSLAALTGNGKPHAQMDETTANGADPDEVAVNTLKSVAEGKGDFVLAASFSSKVAIWLRLLFPSMLQKLLVKRFNKAKAVKDKND
ncbi:MAG: hypothetical protein SGBAC_002741 [Bacillariaceae sp.]